MIGLARQPGSGDRKYHAGEHDEAERDRQALGDLPLTLAREGKLQHATDLGGPSKKCAPIHSPSATKKISGVSGVMSVAVSVNTGLVIISTAGDQSAEPVAEIGVGVFTAAIREAINDDVSEAPEAPPKALPAATR